MYLLLLKTYHLFVLSEEISLKTGNVSVDFQKLSFCSLKG